MKKNKTILYLIGLMLILSLFLVVTQLYSQNSKRSSFGGSRSSPFRSFSSPKSMTPKFSFGGNRTTSPLPRSTNPISEPRVVPPRSSFGGKVSSNIFLQSHILKKYGVPRRVITSRELPNLPSNVSVNHYGDFASGLMMGYLMGHTSWLWFMPFHPAFYFGPPQKVVNPDGTIAYYPPTFDWGKFFMTLIIIGSISFIIFQYFKNRRKSFSYGRGSSRELSKSSFG
ncbi:MAG: hypothetical protein ACUVQ1_07395 [Candidatus Kapaibacteriales bacterium]